MEVKFIEISPSEIKKFFPEFHSEDKVFFEIFKNENPVGLYGIKDIGSDIGEISLYMHVGFRFEMTKKIINKILTFPSELGFKKILISTDLESVERFLRKIEKLGKMDVKYLFENEGLHWFEVNYEF